ncbi:MAG: efflux RND transporter periplasmic adaptor subunit [Muribaculaceae bacterium]|nr:efflux RND transporter periplasmic adaptor subunit [Muribaculaceae bacterium]
MDREIPLKERRKAIIKKVIIGCCILLVIIGTVLWLISWMNGGIKEHDLNLKKVETGEIKSAVTTNGKIIPAFEEILVSPVSSRILEVYVHEGDSVTEGTPLLRLDIEESRNQYQRMADELSIKRSEIKSQTLTNETALTDLEMRIKTKELAVDQLKAEYESEKRLDSIGSGTGERVRKALLAWQTATLELKQLRLQLNNERRIRQAMDESKHIESNISARNLH